MGLSVAISGGIILTVFVLILFSLPGLADKMFSIGDITSQVSQHEKKISDTKLSIDHLSQRVGTSRVNFTLNNDGTEKLWNFEDFDLFIEYNGAISGKTTEQLSYSGECLGAVPQVGEWCIESISNDVADQKILNFGEKASIRTNLNENLATTTTVVTVVTDNGVTFTTGGNTNCGSGIPLPSCKKFGMVIPADSSPLGFGILEGSTFGGTETMGADADGSRISTVTTGVGTDAGVQSAAVVGSAACHLEWNCYLDTRAQLQVLAGGRLFVGFSSVATLPNTDTPCALRSCAGFVVDTNDAVFDIVVNNGGAAEVRIPGTIAENTNVHRFQVRADAANNRFGFTIDEGTEVFVSAQIPAAATNLFILTVFETSDAVNDAFEYYYVYTENDK